MKMQFNEYSLESRTIDTSDLINIIKDVDTVVRCVERTTNTYGEFLFVTLFSISKQRTATFYGCGYHHYYERSVTNKWIGYEIDNKYYTDVINKSIAIPKICEEIEDIKFSYKSIEEQSERGWLFEELSEVSDEDGVKSLLEDYGVF
jgi:hypothetical protein